MLLSCQLFLPITARHTNIWRLKLWMSMTSIIPREGYGLPLSSMDCFAHWMLFSRIGWRVMWNYQVERDRTCLVSGRAAWLIYWLMLWKQMVERWYILQQRNTSIFLTGSEFARKSESFSLCSTSEKIVSWRFKLFGLRHVGAQWHVSSLRTASISPKISVPSVTRDLPTNLNLEDQTFLILLSNKEHE